MSVKGTVVGAEPRYSIPPDELAAALRERRGRRLQPHTLSVAELAAVGVARVSWGPFLHFHAVAWFGEQLASLQE